MNKTKVNNLLKYLSLSNNDLEYSEEKLEEYYKAISWTELHQRPDATIKLAKMLSHRFAYRPPKLPSPINREQELRFATDYWKQGKAIALRGLRAAEQVGDEDAKIAFYNILSRLGILLQDNELILKVAKQWIAINLDDDRTALAYKLKTIAQQIADVSTTTILFQMSLELFEQMGDEVAIADMLLLLGQLKLTEKKPDEAWRYLESAIEECEQLSQIHTAVQTLIGLGRVCQMKGDFTSAKKYLKEAFAKAAELEGSSAQVTYKQLQEALEEVNQVS